jgi:hypothetical protein
MTTKTYKVKGFYGKHTPIDIVMSSETLAEYRALKAVRIDSVEEYSPSIRYVTSEDCSRCKVDAYVPHYNCIYKGKAAGHSAAHCTADACY